MMTERLFLRLEDDPLIAPETTVPAGTLREVVVPPALHGQVAHAMAYEEALAPGMQVCERVLPDGALRLIVELHATHAELRVAGPSAQPVLLTLQGPQRGFSLSLRPGAARVLFGVDAHELAQQVWPWDGLASAPRRDLAARLHAAPDDRTREALLMATLQSMQRDAAVTPEQHHARRAALLLRQRPVHAVADALGLGERRLQQIFRAHVGLSPRAWRRLARLHALLRRLRQAPAAGWAALADEAGFSDQAHLIHEFRALCGLTPEQFRRQRIAGSSKTSARDRTIVGTDRTTRGHRP